MSFVRKIRFGEPQLIAGFVLLLILMVLIGLAGIWRIQSLSTIIEELGRRSLVIEKLVLEMKISNTLYATAVRNFALWQTTKYLGAASGASNLDSIHKNIEDFNRQLASTAKYVYQPLQKQALERLANFVKDLRGLGEQIISRVNL